MSSTHEKPELRLDWCSYAAAKYAVEHWHYSRRMPSGKRVAIGVWESGRFIGVVIFSRGASPQLADPYGLTQSEVCELTRVALDRHETPTSRIVALAVRCLRSFCDGLRLVVSFADPNVGHLGTLYQAGNWVFAGRSAAMPYWVTKDGKRLHDRAVTAGGQGQARKGECRRVEQAGKLRYLMPLDDAMRVQIEPLRKPYPKRAPVSGTSGSQPEAGGANPTRTLQADNAAEAAGGE